MNYNFLDSNALFFILTLIFCLNQGVEEQLLTQHLNLIPKQKSKMLLQYFVMLPKMESLEASMWVQQKGQDRKLISTLELQKQAQ